MTGLKDKIVLITGSSDGIGASTAEEFAGQGSKVFLTGRSEEKLKRVAKKCQAKGVEVGYLAIDLHDEGAAECLAKAVLSRFGTVHILVNNAALDHRADGPLLSATGAEGFDAHYLLQIKVPWLLSGYLAKQLCQNKGSIINVSSSLAEIAFFRAPAYGCMKAAMDHMSMCLAVELGPHGVRVNSVLPGVVNTNYGKNVVPDSVRDKFTSQIVTQNPLKRGIGQPEEVAKTIVFLASDDAAYISGALLAVDAGYRLAHPSNSKI